VYDPICILVDKLYVGLLCSHHSSYYLSYLRVVLIIINIYSPSTVSRFRREASDEKREKIRKLSTSSGSEEEDTASSEYDIFSTVERAFNMITSSAISALVLIPLLICCLVAATMACLPILLLLRVSSILLLPFTSFSSSSACHDDDDVDSSIQPYSPPTSSESVEAITERLFHFMGYSSLQYCPDGSDDRSPSNYVDNMIHATRL
jgi:hypothetical protein